MSIYAIHSSSPKFIFIINFKVMYSSLYKVLPQYFPELTFQYKGKTAKTNLAAYQKFAIVRHPFTRLVSAYKQKCRQVPSHILDEKFFFLERCQKQLLEALEIIRDESYDIVDVGQTLSPLENPKNWARLEVNSRLLLSISFDEFVDCVCLILKRPDADGHFTAQYKAFELGEKKSIISQTHIFKLEEIEFGWENICRKLGKEMVLPHTNRTSQPNQGMKDLFTPQSYAKAAEAYKKDFQCFDYSF